MRPLKINEVVQSGDTFLCHFKCLNCLAFCFTDILDPYCGKCHTSFTQHEILPPSTRTGYRLLAGTKRKNKGRIKKATVHRLVAEAEGYCAYCDQPHGAAYEIEHILPLSFGGTNNISNLVLSCVACNRFAGSRVFVSFLAKRLWLAHRRGKARFSESE